MNLNLEIDPHSKKELEAAVQFLSHVLSLHEPAKAEAAKAEPAKAEPAKAEPAKAEPAKAEPAKAEPDYAEVIEAITTLASEKGRQAVVEVLASFGAKNGKELPESEYGAFIAACKEV